MRTDYAAHDEEYQRRKARGDAGWSTPAAGVEDIAALEEILVREYVPKSGRFLELGCGAGGLTLWFAQRGYEAYGVDISPTAISWANEKADELGVKADFRVDDVTELNEYADEFFDFVLDAYCFHCIIPVVQRGQSLDDRQRFLASVHRVLKPGGYFRVNTMCSDPVDPAILARFDATTRCVMRDGPNGPFAERYHGRAKDILDEIRGADFRVLQWEIADNEHPGMTVDATKP